MTDVLEDTQPIVVEGIPNHRATSGERGDGYDKDFSRDGDGNGKVRPGIFGRGTGTRPKMAVKAKKETVTVPKLGPHMRQKITDFYILVGGLVMPFDPLAGETIIEQAPKCGKAVYDYAQENAAFRRIIQGFLTTSMTGALIFAHIPIILVLLRHSKSERTQMTAAGMMVAMKMMDQQTADEVFASTDEDESV